MNKIILMIAFLVLMCNNVTAHDKPEANDLDCQVAYITAIADSYSDLAYEYSNRNPKRPFGFDRERAFKWSDVQIDRKIKNEPNISCLELIKFIHKEIEKNTEMLLTFHRYR
jgi:hypothetical protein